MCDKGQKQTPLIFCSMHSGKTLLAVFSFRSHTRITLFSPTTSDNMNRIFLWCVPRTCSTVILKCLSFVEGLQAVNEPYNCAFRAGPERKKSDWPDMNDPVDKRLFKVYNYASNDDEILGFDEEHCTYGWIRDEILQACV